MCLCMHVETRGLPQEHWPSTSIETKSFIGSWETETGGMRYWDPESKQNKSLKFKNNLLIPTMKTFLSELNHDQSQNSMWPHMMADNLQRRYRLEGGSAAPSHQVFFQISASLIP